MLSFCLPSSPGLGASITRAPRAGRCVSAQNTVPVTRPMGSGGKGFEAGPFFWTRVLSADGGGSGTSWARRAPKDAAQRAKARRERIVRTSVTLCRERRHLALVREARIVLPLCGGGRGALLSEAFGHAFVALLVLSAVPPPVVQSKDTDSAPSVPLLRMPTKQPALKVEGRTMR